MHGSRRTNLIALIARTTEGIARAGRLFVRLAAGRGHWGLTDLYAAAATAKFIAAHELIDRAEAQAHGGDVVLDQVRLPLWFGSTTLHEEN